jgi:hypothetical protein
MIRHVATKIMVIEVTKRKEKNDVTWVINKEDTRTTLKEERKGGKLQKGRSGERSNWHCCQVAYLYRPHLTRKYSLSKINAALENQRPIRWPYFIIAAFSQIINFIS